MVDLMDNMHAKFETCLSFANGGWALPSDGPHPLSPTDTTYCGPPKSGLRAVVHGDGCFTILWSGFTVFDHVPADRIPPGIRGMVKHCKRILDKLPPQEAHEHIDWLKGQLEKTKKGTHSKPSKRKQHETR
jgi:hypothetical protein